MYINGIDFPNEIIEAINKGKLVVFAGAGVSMGEPTELPDFSKLSEQVAIGTGLVRRQSETYEAFLGRLKHQHIDVNKIAADILSKMNLKYNKLHEYIIELFPQVSKIKIVTTNYDNMFEQILAQKEIENVKVYDAPALPLGNDIKGIIHIHGNVKEPEYMVLTDEDFGRAYLSDGYVSRFLVKLFEEYTVLFIGYSYNDMIVRYLTRAITKYHSQKRYILTDSINDSWSELGIKPILFEKGRFDVLNEGVYRLGERIKRGLGDWKNSLSLIAQQPPKDLSLKSELDFCMQDISKARIFMDYISGEEWLWWADEKGFLNNLFLSGAQLTEMDNLWLNWLVDKYVGKEDILIKKLVLKHYNQINLQMANQIIEKIAYDNNLFHNDVLKEYIILLDTFLVDSWTISRVIDIVMDREIYSLGWTLYKKLFDIKMVLKENLLSSEENKIDYQVIILGEGYSIENGWEKYGAIYLDYNALDVLTFGMHYITKIHSNYALVGMASREEESYELLQGISNEEDETVSRQRDAIFILRELIIGACKKIEDTDKNYIRYYIEQCIKSESTLLRVIGIKLLRNTKCFSNDEKATLLVNNIDLFSFWEKEQTFKLVADIFDKINTSNQSIILSEIEKGRDYKDKEISAYAKYNWAIWLQKKCKNNVRITSIIEGIKLLYPEFQPREKPELSFWSSEVSWGGNISPIDENEMKTMDIIQLVELLKMYEGDKWEGPSREGLLNTFANCIGEDFKWLCKMFETLVREFVFEADVWDYFFIGLQKRTLNVEEVLCLLSKFNNEDLVEIRYLELSNFVKEIIDSECIKKNFDKCGEKIFNMSKRIWMKRGKENRRIGRGRLIDQCLNYTTGILTAAWVKMLFYESNRDILPKYKKLFQIILSGDEKEQAICVLVGQINFLFSRDKEWCRKNLFIFLKSENKEEFEAAWEGIAWYARHLHEDLADEMIPIYLYAVDRLEELSGEARKAFVSMYTCLAIYVVDNPILTFIPKLFKVAHEEDRRQFSGTIYRSLLNMEEEPKKKLWDTWLKEYWCKRVKNIPVPLQEYEQEEMLKWVFELNQLYPEAIELFIYGPTINKTDSLFCHRLEEGKWAERYPDATAQIIIFLLNSKVNLGFERKKVKEIAQSIICSDKSKQDELQEALLQSGL